MEQKNDTLIHTVTPATMEDFLSFESGNGASANTVRRLSCAIRSLYDYLTDDKVVTRDALVGWRKSMEDNGYASQTVQNYVKYVNRYLDFAGCSAIRFQRGRAKDISGRTFGYLTALSPTEKRDRKDVVWLCQCRCGKLVELPATRLLLNNTLSCGCLQRETLQKVNKCFFGTSLEQSIRDPVTSSRSMSGYIGVTRKRDKWQAYITYKGRHFSLGVYEKLEDAVKARAVGKEAVIEDAKKLLRLYEELHRNDESLSEKANPSKGILSRRAAGGE